MIVMKNEIKILLVEDNTRDAELVEHELHKLDIEFICKRVDAEKEYLKSLKEFSPDIVLSDYNLSFWNGMRALELAQKNCPNIPFLIVTGSMNEETAVECLKAGASDYVTKEHLIRLVPAIKLAMEKKGKYDLLLEKEEILTIITENVTDLIAILDLNGKRIYNSSSYEKLFGKLEDLQGTDSFAEIHPDDREKIRKIFRETIETGRGMTSEYRFVLKDGSIRHIESQGNLIRDSHGNPSKVLVVARNVTERKEKVKELNILAHAITSINECVSITDKDNNIYFLNDPFLKTYGYTEKELIGKHISILRPEKDRENPIPDIYAATLKDSWCGELYNRKKDGTIFPIYLSTSPVRDDDGEVLALVGVATDITERKRIEEALVKSRDFYLKLFEEFPTLIWRAGVNGKRDYANKTMLDFTGQTPERESGDGWIQGIHPEDVDDCLPKFFDTFKNRTTLNIEYRLRRHDGVYRWIMDYGRPFYDLEGNFAGYIGSCHDITDIKETEKKLRDSEISYHGLFNSVADAIYIQDMNGYFLDVNQGAMKMYGYPKEAFIGRTPEFLSAPGKNDMEKTLSFVKAAFDGNPQRFEWWGIRKNGEVFPKDVRLSKGMYLDQKVIIAIARDITETIKIQEILNQVNAELKEKVITLEKFRDVAIDRELKMIELKEKIKSLEQSK
jgi:PAS domain S-box-containing protein